MLTGKLDSVVLFGAGASAFCGGVRPRNPPLGTDLFAELVRYSPTVWGTMSQDVQARFTTDFESGMRWIWGKYPIAIQSKIPGVPSPYALMRTMAAYFLQFKADGTGSDLYSRFVNVLHHHNKLDRVRLATLNYEGLLESGLAALGNPLHVLRPHGAANWWVEGSVLLVGRGRAIGAGFNCIGRRVRAIPRNAILERMEKEGKYPAMAIYMPEKRT